MQRNQTANLMQRDEMAKKITIAYKGMVKTMNVLRTKMKTKANQDFCASEDHEKF